MLFLRLIVIPIFLNLEKFEFMYLPHPKEVAEQIKCLPCEHESWSFSPQNHVKAGQAWCLPVIPGARRHSQGILEASWLVILSGNDELLVQQKTHLNKQSKE